MATDKPPILVIDDDHCIKFLAEVAAPTEGHDVSVPCHGRQAQDEIPAGETYDLIVLDLMMPVMDGLEFLRWLLQERRQTTSVLVETAMETAGTHHNQLQVTGVDALMYEPRQLQTLLEQVRSMAAGASP